MFSTVLFTIALVLYLVAKSNKAKKNIPKKSKTEQFMEDEELAFLKQIENDQNDGIAYLNGEPVRTTGGFATPKRVDGTIIFLIVVTVALLVVLWRMM